MNTITFGKVIDPGVETTNGYGRIFKFCLYSRGSGAREFTVWEQTTDYNSGEKKVNPLFAKCQTLKDGDNIVALLYVSDGGKVYMNNFAVDTVNLKEKVNALFK